MTIPTHMLNFSNDKIKVIKYYGQSENKRKEHLWSCKCNCGKIIILSTAKIKIFNACRGHPKVHGLTKRNEKFHPLYRLWCNMRTRCYNPEMKIYKYYKGKNIIVCNEWHDAKKFYDWAMNNGWKKGLTIDRIDSNGNYEPSNCRFITKSENSARMAQQRWDIKPGKNLNCALCDAVYYRMPSRIKESKYCSRKCAMLGLHLNRKV